MLPASAWSIERTVCSILGELQHANKFKLIHDFKENQGGDTLITTKKNHNIITESIFFFTPSLQNNHCCLKSCTHTQTHKTGTCTTWRSTGFDVLWSRFTTDLRAHVNVLLTTTAWKTHCKTAWGSKCVNGDWVRLRELTTKKYREKLYCCFRDLRFCKPVECSHVF